MHNRYFLMRHGESEANVADLIISYPETGCKRYGLSKQGRQQVRLSALESGLGSDTLIISSDFLRARETATLRVTRKLADEGYRTTSVTTVALNEDVLAAKTTPPAQKP